MASPYLFCSCPGNRAIVAQPQASNKDISYKLFQYKYMRKEKQNKSVERKRNEIYEVLGL